MRKRAAVNGFYSSTTKQYTFSYFERFPRFQQIIILLDINALSVYMQIVTDDQHDERRNQGRIHTFESSLLPLVRLEY